MDKLSVDEACSAVASGGVVIDRPERGLIRLTGPQRIWFLQNTISNDVDNVEPGHWIESCFLELKGKVLAHFNVAVLPEEVWLDVDEPGTADLLDWFVRYRFRTKVEIEDRTGQAPCVMVAGSAARDLAQDGRVRSIEDALVFGATLGSIPIAVVHGTIDALRDLPEADATLAEVLRIEAGVGRFGADYGPDTLPQEAGLGAVISVTKGCYVGQEVMARLHFRGHVNRTIRKLEFTGQPDTSSLPGRELTVGGQRVGKVTSAVESPERGAIGIGMVRVAVQPGDTVDVAGGGQATVGPLPDGTKLGKAQQ